MSEPTKHTPAPWFVKADMRTEKDGQEYLAGYDVRSEAGEVIGCEGIIPGPRSEADAHLIAAAPELLAALKELRGWMPPAGDDRINVSLVKADAAISKAERVVP